MAHQENEIQTDMARCINIIQLHCLIINKARELQILIPANQMALFSSTRVCDSTNYTVVKNEENRYKIRELIITMAKNEEILNQKLLGDKEGKIEQNAKLKVHTSLLEVYSNLKNTVTGDKFLNNETKSGNHGKTTIV